MVAKSLASDCLVGDFFVGDSLVSDSLVSDFFVADSLVADFVVADFLELGRIIHGTFDTMIRFFCSYYKFCISIILANESNCIVLMAELSLHLVMLSIVILDGTSLEDTSPSIAPERSC